MEEHRELKEKPTYPEGIVSYLEENNHNIVHFVSKIYKVIGGITMDISTILIIIIGLGIVVTFRTVFKKKIKYGEKRLLDISM